jgi:hypothetical protein
MSATIQFNGKTATITDGVWKSDDVALQVTLQRFVDKNSDQYIVRPDYFVDSLAAEDTLKFLGEKAKITHVDTEDDTEDDDLDENGFDKNGMPRIY